MLFRFGVFMMGMVGCTAFAADAAAPMRSRESFNTGWRFFRCGSMPDGSALPEPTNPPLSSMTFDDSTWRSLEVPHDWGIEGPFRSELDSGSGKLPWQAIGWYRKHFTVPAEDKGQRIFIDFDGAMANAEVWLNGKSVGGWPYGYNSFRLELTPQVVFGGENVLAVRLDTTMWGSRWYPGGGIYRNVWLVKTAPVHVGQWGVQVITPTLTDERGDVRLAVTVDNQAETNATAKVRTEIHERARSGGVGAKVAETTVATKKIAAGASATLSLAASVARPKRWELTAPAMYVARTIVTVNDAVVDTYDVPFGFRRLEFTPRDGFRLNGKRVAINGVCNHHDLGPLGAAVNTRALERQLELLRDMGCNAIRTSHNPPTPELLDLADRMGFLVQVEAFDCWASGKRQNDYSRLFKDWHEKDLRAMVRRDRNHPSVFMWSIGNEIHEQGGPDMASQLRAIVHGEDNTRPVTAGCNNGDAAFNGFQTAVDVFGLNYNLHCYDRFFSLATHKDLAMLSTESSSCISSRGEYFFPVKRGGEAEVNFQVSSYDVDAPGWACPPDEQFSALDRHPATMGEFVWTGFDYIGEPTPYNADASILLNFSDPEKRAEQQRELDRLGKIKVPSASSYFGILDLCGFRKDRFYSYQSRWRPELPMAHIMPHWNWPERIGQVTPVHVYTSGDDAELFLNGTSLGRKKKGQFEYRLRWDDVKYQPGELKVVAYRNGKKWAEATTKTTGAPAQVRLKADRAKIAADGCDLSFVTVSIADKNGEVVPRSHNLVTFSIEGPGEIVAVGNGDAASHDPYQAMQRKAFNGLCLVVVKAKPGQTGTIMLRAASEGLACGEAAIESAARDRKR